MVEEVSSKDLDNILNENKVVFIDCHAVWCAPCRMLSPILEEVYEEYKNQGLKVVKLDVDQNMEFTAENAITGVPSVFVYSEGKRVIFDDGNGNKSDRLIGVMPSEIYQGIAKDLLAQASA